MLLVICDSSNKTMFQLLKEGTFHRHKVQAEARTTDATSMYRIPNGKIFVSLKNQQNSFARETKCSSHSE